MRTESDSPFHEEDEEIANSYLVWGEVAIHYADLYSRVGRQKDLSGFLLSVVRSIFMEMVSMDALILKIMNFAQRLVTADRASLFLVDTKTNQLYARIFDVSGGKDGVGAGEFSSSDNDKDFTKEIRFVFHQFLNVSYILARVECLINHFPNANENHLVYLVYILEQSGNENK